MTKYPNKKVHCNNCERKTNHSVFAKYEQEGSDENFSWGSDYFILGCMGCESVSFLKSYMDSDSGYYDDNGNWYNVPDISIYPPRIARNEPKWMDALCFGNNKNLYDVLREVYTALQNDLSILATQGTRTALETVMLEKVGDNGSFEKNIDAFIRAGHMQQELKDSLMSALDAGNAAAHRAYKPEKDEISEIFDLVEGIIHAVVIIPDKAKRVKDKTPQRKTRGNKPLTVS